jgi:hypothetical protein
MVSCEHKNTDMGYGSARSAGYRGLGVYIYCEDCKTIISFSEDGDCTSPEEIEHNNKVRTEGLK